ncbi:pre-mRNA-splicing factor syf1 [Coemansia sp. RSA 1722]|nr:pre-mRNA-splicing factor syf1 [Coemansia sp. RSA 486]KAJ2605377.1 pre-mRNA-splicing factor syf1 [Coemansia sp. RSA 1722]
MELDITDDDLRFESEVQRTPYKVSAWQRYIGHKQPGDFRGQAIIYERALQRIPFSYKLWKQYLNTRVKNLQGKNPLHWTEEYRKTELCFERALLYLPRMPRIWLDYCGFIMGVPDISVIRKVFDRALRALPVTLHERVWAVYLEWGRRIGGVVGKRVWKRCMRVWPQRTAEYGRVCEEWGLWKEAATVIIAEIEKQETDDGWRRLSRLLRAHPDALGDRADPVLRDGIRRGHQLWTVLAAHHLACNHVDRARDVYEEAMTRVSDMKQFSVVFDSYAQMEQETAAAAMDLLVDGQGSQQDVDLVLLRLERLMDRRALLANDVMLRENRGDVGAWLERARIWEQRKNDKQVKETFEAGVRAMDECRVGARATELWMAYAKWAEQPDGFRSIMGRAVVAALGTATAVADLYLSYAETEISWGELERARRVLTQATAEPRNWASLPANAPLRAFLDRRLWSLLVDLEESQDSVEATRLAYDRMLELKIATPQTVVDYAVFLEERGFFEDSFRVYERGIHAFGYPVAVDLWSVYLRRFAHRYGGSKVERTRDLFEQALDKCPAEYSKPLYVAFGAFEEEHGMGRRALAIYARATQMVARGERLEMYRFYVAKTVELLGAPACRSVYEQGISDLSDSDAVALAIDYAAAERQLGEIDRARALFAYAAQLSDPHMDTVWNEWHAFEVRHGNEETFKEMLRVKRLMVTKHGADAKSMARVEMLKKESKMVKEKQVKEPLVEANPDAVVMDDDDL